MNKVKVLNILLSCFFIAGINGCKNKVTQVSSPVNIFRFDKELFLCKTQTDFENLYRQQPEFYYSFCQDILGIKGNYNNPLFIHELKNFKNNYGIGMLQQEVDSVFPNLTEIELQLAKSKDNFKKEFPNNRFPNFVSFISEFTFANVSYDTIIGIGLDFYLGSNYPLYKVSTIDFPDFMVKKLRKEYIVPNTLKAVGISMFEHQLKDKRFLAFMLFEGKMKYFVKQMLPELHDTLIFGISNAQLNWCKQNETQMWGHYIEKKILYSYDVDRFMRYINDGPFTIAEGVPQQSSPSIGVYTGYRIIEEFAKETGLSLQEIMEYNDWDEILQKSKYRPE